MYGKNEENKLGNNGNKDIHKRKVKYKREKYRKKERKKTVKICNEKNR